MPLDREDYAKLRSAFQFLEERYVVPALPTLAPEHRASAVLARQEKESIASAQRGLAMAINDLVEALQDLSPAEVAECDRALEAQGSYTLSALRQRYSKQYRRIIERAAICSDEEFYLAQGVLSDTSLPLPDSEKILLDRLIHAYRPEET